MVGASRFELATSSPPDWCANRAALRSEVRRTIERACAGGNRQAFCGVDDCCWAHEADWAPTYHPPPAARLPPAGPKTMPMVMEWRRDCRTSVPRVPYVDDVTLVSLAQEGRGDRDGGRLPRRTNTGRKPISTIARNVTPVRYQAIRPDLPREGQPTTPRVRSTAQALRHRYDSDQARRNQHAQGDHECLEEISPLTDRYQRQAMTPRVLSQNML